MKKILVIADMKVKRQAAIHRGLELAKRSGVDVQIIAFVFDTYVSEQQDQETAKLLQQAMIEARSKEINEIIQNLDAGKIQLSSEIVWDKNVADWIMKNATPEKFSTIIITGHRTENIVHTPTDWRVLRQSIVPVMIVAEKAWRKKNIILCSIDLGKNDKKNRDLNRHIIGEAKALADLFKGQLHCCYVIPLPEVLIDLDILNKKRIIKKARKEAEAHFSEIATEFGLDLSSLHIRGGKTEKIIPSVANKLKATMLVISTVGRKGLRAKILGNTAEKVLHQLRTDVLTLKSK